MMRPTARRSVKFSRHRFDTMAIGPAAVASVSATGRARPPRSRVDFLWKKTLSGLIALPVGTR